MDADRKKNTCFGILRHAPTVWNAEKRLQGQQDSPLLPQSKTIAKQWGGILARYVWDQILVSDLGRTCQTAELINQTLKLCITHDSRLREKDWGRWTGRQVRQIKKKDPDLLKNMESKGWDFRPPDGENRMEVWKRSHEALMQASQKWPGQKILVITHEGVIKCLIYRLLKRRFLPSESSVLKTGHLHTLEHNGHQLEIQSLNFIDLILDTP